MTFINPKAKHGDASDGNLGGRLSRLDGPAKITGSATYAVEHQIEGLVYAVGAGAGFTLALVTLGGAREILGSGSLFGVSLFGDSFEPWVIMLLPPGGFLMLGFILLLFAWIAELRRQPSAGVPATEKEAA